MFSLYISETYSLSGTNKNPFQTDTFLIATAYPSQTLYQPPTAPNISPSTNIPSLCPVPTVKPKHHFPVFTENLVLLLQ